MRKLLIQFFDKSLLILIVLSFSSITAFAQNDELSNRLLNASSYTIAADPEMLDAMTAIAEQAIETHCANCHGADLAGQIGVPNLVDYDWLWGVTGFEVNSAEAIFKIMQTILYGVRNEDCPEDIKQYGACPDTRFSQMPAYGDLGYSQDLVSDLTEYTLSISGNDADEEAVARAESTWVVCTECHGEEGYGYKDYGGPDLRDDVWLFGASKEQIRDVIDHGRTESCPAWAQTLDPVTIKALAVYIYGQSFGL